MFKNSIIVTAHPDDEILWFSSIIDKVDEVLICYLDVKSNPQWTVGRKKSLSEHPMKNISCLDIDESEVFSIDNWKNPVITKYGMEISNKGAPEKKYMDNYSRLKAKLESKLKGRSNVFTHNPWGEYGHEEHVQVYRVVKELQKKMPFNMWYSNYSSNKSFNLTSRYISGFDSEYVIMKTNKTQANDIKELYKKNECWTWYDNWEWFNEESFKKDNISEERIENYGHTFPLNMIKVELTAESKRMPNIFKKIVATISRNIKKKSLWKPEKRREENN